MVTNDFTYKEVVNFLQSGDYPNKELSANKKRLLRRIREKQLFVLIDGNMT